MMPEHCESICSSLKQILSVPVDVCRKELTELKVRAQSVKDLSTVEVSLGVGVVVLVEVVGVNTHSQPVIYILIYRTVKQPDVPSLEDL